MTSKWRVFETAECEEFHTFGPEIWKAQEPNERLCSGTESKQTYLSCCRRANLSFCSSSCFLIRALWRIDCASWLSSCGDGTLTAGGTGLPAFYTEQTQTCSVNYSVQYTAQLGKLSWLNLVSCRIKLVLKCNLQVMVTWSLESESTYQHHVLQLSLQTEEQPHQ